MPTITRDALAKRLIQEAEENGGALGVLALSQECQRVLESLPNEVKHLLHIVEISQRGM